MKMSKNYKKICLALALTGVIGAGTVTAKSGNQSITATYRNIQVTYNGATQPMSNEPFIVNGSVYVPLAAVGNIFGASANWYKDSNTVALTGGNVGGSSNAAVQEELTQAKYQITALNTELTNTKAELAKANAELAQYKANASNNNSNNNNTNTSGTNITNAQLKDTENYLNQNFSDYLKNINMNYSLTLYGNQIQVEMTYNTRQENNNFKKLSQYNVQAFMKKIGDTIAATHSDVTIEGRILYGNDNSEKASFTRSRNGNYNYEYAFDASTIQDILTDEVGNYFYFNNMNINGFNGSLQVTNYDVNVRENSSKVNVSVYLASNDAFKKLWGIDSKTNTDTATFDRNYAVRNQLNTIFDYVCEVANDYDVNIIVYYNNNMIAQMDSDEKITTNTFTYTSN